MAFFGLFRRCATCGSLRFHTNLKYNGDCNSCATTKRIATLSFNDSPPKKITKEMQIDPLETARRGSIYAHDVFNGCSMVYRYPNVSVSNVNRDVLRKMVVNKDYGVTLVISDTGDVLAMKDGDIVAKIEDKAQMCKDWMNKNRPLVCEFVVFKKESERIALFFYRSETEEMEGYSCENAKLTSCMSASKQESIACLEEGQRLFVEMDDNEKPYVRDICYNPIGRLPAKYNRLYENDQVRGIYFDHSEIVEAEDCDKEDKEIPYVRVYIEK